MHSQTTKVLRVNSIVDVPGHIECMSVSRDKKLVAVGRADHSIEIWTTDSWIQLLKIPGSESKFI